MVMEQRNRFRHGFGSDSTSSLPFPVPPWTGTGTDPFPSLFFHSVTQTCVALMSWLRLSPSPDLLGNMKLQYGLWLVVGFWNLSKIQAGLRIGPQVPNSCPRTWITFYLTISPGWLGLGLELGNSGFIRTWAWAYPHEIGAGLGCVITRLTLAQLSWTTYLIHLFQ